MPESKLYPTIGEMFDGEEMPDVFCTPCLDGTHQCDDLFEVLTNDGPMMVACDCMPCHDAYNKKFWEEA